MPRLTYKLSLPNTYPQTAVVIDAGFSELLGMPRLCPIALSCSQTMAAHHQALKRGLKRNPAWLGAFYQWVVSVRPTIISLSPDLLVDTLLYVSCLTPESYGFGVPKHVPALYKPNGSLNWFQFKSRRIPKPASGFFALQNNGLACHRDLDSSTFPEIPHTSPAVHLEDAPSPFKQLRKDARGRLERASQILVLGIDVSSLTSSDVQFLSGLAPTKRLTLVSPTPLTANALVDRCAYSGFVDLEYGGLESWLVNRLPEWDAA